MAKKRKLNNRILRITKDMTGVEEADVIMAELEAILQETKTDMPIPGKVYVYSYIAEKKNFLTDLYPIVQVTGVYEWGWSGMNLHVQEPRNYSIGRNLTPLYMLKPQEVAPALSLPLMNLYQN